ncbi:hypothetical protein HDU97_008348 [Phlyctochytrium planicorne]|nr:hypothetical protein HDU97_008348 [Phlyctochytrium planicorne]
MLAIASLIAVAVASLSSSVVAQAPTANSLQCVTSYDAAVDYFPEKVDATKLEATSSLKFTYGKNYKVITNAVSNETVLLYQCGTPIPTTVTANRTIAVPVKSATISDTTIVTYLELLGKTSTVKYTTGGAQFIVDPCVQSLTSTNKDVIQDVSKTDAVAEGQINSTDVFFAFYSSYNTNNSVAFPATQDKTNLNRVDWLFYVSAFFNAESRANAVVSSIKTNYNCVKSAVAASPASPIPTVAIINYDAPSPYNNNTVSYILENYDYFENLVTDAGGKVVKVDSAKKTPLGSNASFKTAKELIAAIGDPDIVIDNTFSASTSAETLKNFELTDASTLKFIKNKQIFNANKKQNSVGGTAFYEDAVVNQQLVLSDLVSIIRTNILPSYTRRYFRNLFPGTEAINTLTATTCPDVKALDAGIQVESVQCPSGVTVSTTATSGKPNSAAKVGAGVFGAAVAAVAMML